MNKTRTICYDIETTGLLAFEHRILCISIIDADTSEIKSFCEDDEEKLLKDFFEEVKDVKNFVGYNSQSFDAPFILQRCLFYGIKLTPEFLNINRQVDLRKHALGFFLSYNRFAKGKLTDWAAKLGLPVETSSGEHMPKLYLEGKWDEIEKHCLEDIKLTLVLYNRLLLCGVLK